MILFVGLVSFAVGVGVGILFRDALEIARTGRGFIVRSLRSVRLSFRTVGIALVVIALVVNGLLGFLQIATRDAVDDQSRDLTRLSECNERYNRLSGEARDDRDDLARGITATELRLWARFRRMIANPTSGGRGEALDAIDDYRNKIRDLQQTRTANPYPDPDLCVEEARER